MPWNPAGVYLVVKTLSVLLLPAWTMKKTASTTKTPISNTPRAVPSRGRGADAVEAGREHDHRAEQRPRPPQVRRVPVELRVQRGGGGEPELEQHQRRDQEPDQHVPPGHQEPDGGVQAPRGVGGHRSRRRHLPRQLADAHRAEQARDQGEDDRERQRAAREGDAGRDRRGDGRAGGHVGDALERDLTQADGVPPQAGGGSVPVSVSPSTPSRRPQPIIARMFSR